MNGTQKNITSKSWDNENRLNATAKFVVFFINPIVGVLLSLYHINTKSSYAILFLAFVAFGFSMVVPEIGTDDFGFDSVVYRNNFEDVTLQDSRDFQEILAEYFLLSETGGTDIYSTALMFLVAKFTSNYHVFFMVVAIVMAIFMLKTLRYLTSESNYRFSIYGLCLLFLFTMSQIIGVNMVRFYTAYWIALFALFKIFVDKQNRYFILIALTPLVHASYLLMLVIVPLTYLLHNRPRLVYILLIFSVVFSTLSLTFLTYIIDLLPSSLASHYDAYIDKDYMYRINESGTGYIWVRRILETLVWLSINIIAFIFTKQRKNIEGTKCHRLYPLLMAVVVFVNFTIGIPSVGSRYIMFVYPLIAYISLLCFPDTLYRKIISVFALFYISMFLILPWNIYQVPCLRFYTKLLDVSFWLYSPIVSFFKYVILA